MSNEHIPSYQLHMGQRILAVPRDATTPRGPKLGCIPVGGMELRVDDYILGCIQRGALLAYPVEAPTEQVAEVVEPAAAQLPTEHVPAPAEPAAEKETI